MELFCLEKRRFQGDLIAAFLKVTHWKDEAKLFRSAGGDKTRGMDSN